MRQGNAVTDVERRLHALELDLLRSEIRHSPELISFLLADDFREFGSSGRVFNRDEIIAALRTESAAEFSISDFRVQVLATDIALVTYRALRQDSLKRVQICSLRSSLWVVRDGQWQILFHQGTRAAAD